MRKLVLGLGLVVTSMALLTGCNTTKGAVQGAGQDVQATKDALTPAPAAKPVHHKKHHHKKKAATTTNATTSQNTTNNQDTTQTTTQTTTTQAPAANQ